MTKGDGTRSGLLWEVERLLREMTERPQVLLMENVPQVIGKKNISDFSKWIAFLDGLGYKSKWQILNAKDYGIPQNRERCFMVSILGDYYYDFPKPRKPTVRLKDFLDKRVDEKYYLSDKTIEMFIEHTAKQQAKGNGFKFEPSDGGGTQRLSAQGQERELMTILLSNKGTQYERTTECAANPNGARLQGLRQSSDERRSGNKGADGFMLGTSEQFNAGLCKEMSRSITTEGKNGVVEWKK